MSKEKLRLLTKENSEREVEWQNQLNRSFTRMSADLRSRTEEAIAEAEAAASAAVTLSADRETAEQADRAEIEAVNAENAALETELVLTAVAGAERFYTVPIERYQSLLATRESNRLCRAAGVETFRLWAAGAHPEVTTVEEALQACTAEELEQFVQKIWRVPEKTHWGYAYEQVIRAAARRLEDKRARAERERAYHVEEVTINGG